MRSPGRALRIDSDRPSGTRPMPGGGDEHLVALAAVDDLGVAGDQRHAGLVAGRAHRGDDALQVGQRQPFFEDERRREEQRRGAADGQVVDGAVDRQPADVAAGEEERPDHERVGGEGEPRRLDAVAAVEADGRLVLQRREHVVAEAGHEQPLDQVGRQRPPLPWPSRMWS